jgi:hypothetical protein
MQQMSSIRSVEALLTVLPVVTITSQPQSIRTAIDVDTSFTIEASITDTRYIIQYYWTIDDVIQNNSNSRIFTISGSEIGEKKVRAYAYIDVTSENEGSIVTNRSISSSDEVTWNIGPPRSIIRFEGFTPTGGYKYVDANLDDGDFTLDDSIFDSTYNIVTYYAREKDLDLTMHMDGAPGETDPPDAQNPGEGGRSSVTLNHTQNIEHTVLGTTNNSAVFLYRGSNLLLVVGQGGSGNGGNGGGVNVAGANGRNNVADGGQLIPIGSLNLNGEFGSNLTNVTLQSGDTLANPPQGGRTISCSKGSYWTGLGISPCEDNSTSRIKFRIADGTEVILSDNIIRGFKSGYTITSTEGRAENSTTGVGGRGATGGSGTSLTGYGGGGGSGYSDGTATIFITQLGGVPVGEKAKIKFSLVPPPPQTKTGTVTHGFNNSTNTDIFLSFDGAIVDCEPQNRGSADRQGGTGEHLKYYILTMNSNYTNLSVEMLQDATAGGGPGMGLRPTKIEKIDSYRWGVWFNKAIGFNSFARNWSVTGS